MDRSIYEPLAPHEIRLLRFTPDDDLVADLERVVLHDAPPYIALSYTWGRAPYRKGRSLSAKYSITLNSQLFEVQENLHDALLYLVPEVRKKSCLLWVDAICINQSDVQERNTQILHMRYIYEHANMVFGWLGVPFSDEETSLATSIMRNFNIVLRDGLAEHNGNMNAVAAQISPSNKDIYPEPGTDCYKGWLGIREIFNQRYWKRIWIYQEATGTAPTRFCCGNEYFDTVLLNASVYMAHHFAEFGDIDFHFRDVARGPAFALSAFRDNGVCKYGDTLLELLEFLRTTESSEPRDKVYALLGFASDLSSSDIVPDYSRPLEEVYKDVVRFSLSRADSGLEILGHVTHPPADLEQEITRRSPFDFPSWVPDFREYIGPNPFCTKVLDGSWAYHACGSYTSHDAQIDGSKLTLLGMEIDHIATISSTWKTNVFSTAEVESWAPTTPDSIYHPTGQTMDEAFRITVLADMNVLTKSRGHMVDFELLNARGDGLTADQSDRRNKMNVALKTAGVRRLCWTKEGRVGLVPPTARVGDLLYILTGGQMIYMLRGKDTGTFRFVGEAYIHGIMDGEIFEKADVQLPQLEKVVLD
ncbi:MAG: hypothetical protein Q9171_005514 [Xanthocarpia ochracea]